MNPSDAGHQEAKSQDPLFYGAIAIFALVFAAYFPALRAGFAWDDDHHFTDNPVMTAPGGLLQIWADHPFYYPLTLTTWRILRQVAGLNPFPYHALNVFLHALNSVLLWRLLRRLAIPGAWLAAAIFAMHPVNVQSVAWATELKNCQSGFFYLVSLLAWTCFRRNEPKRQWMWYGISIAGFLLALTSKTSTVVLPFGLMVIDLWTRVRIAPRIIAQYIPFFGLAGFGGLLTVVGHQSMVAGPEWDLSLAQRIPLAARCVWFYLFKLAVPLDLSFVYPRWDIAGAGPAAWVSFFAIIAVFAFLLINRKATMFRPALLAFAFFVAALIPVLNLFKMYYARYSFVADHWQYLAAMPAIAWAIGGLAWILKNRAPGISGRMKIMSSAALLVVLGFLTWRQCGIYLDSETLWLDVLSKNPDAEIAYNNLGAWHLERDELSAADQVLRAGLALHPGDIELTTMLGAALIGERHWEEAEMLMADAERRAPGDPEILNNLGLAENALGRRDTAIAHFREAVARDPQYVDIQINLIDALAAAGRTAEAQAALDAARRASPNDSSLAQLKISEASTSPAR